MIARITKPSQATYSCSCPTRANSDTACERHIRVGRYQSGSSMLSRTPSNYFDFAPAQERADTKAVLTNHPTMCDLLHQLRIDIR